MTLSKLAASCCLVVLAIDDDPDALRLMKLHLRSAQGLTLRVHTFTDWRIALTELPSIEPDVMVLDYQLKDTTGIEVFEKVAEAGFSVPAILATGMGAETLVRDALHKGFADYIPKTLITGETLGRSIENAVDKHHLRQEVLRHQAEQARLIADLERRNEEIQSFYHSLSHELKTPLTAIREFASILADELQGPLNEGQQSSIGRISSATERMTSDINRMLDLTRMDSGKLSLELSPEPLEPLFECAMAQVAECAEAEGVTLEVPEVEGGVPVLCDRRRVEQVVLHLMENAIKFTPAGGSISLSARQLAGARAGMEISVRDNGQGIRPGDLDSIFERHYQTSEGDAALHGGLGLGLHICRQIVTLHGGEICVESDWGAGSHFKFTLPSPASSDSPVSSPVGAAKAVA